ncbi:MAG TPA: hypothetical protein VGM63_15880 [Mucilaginibacter sp.]|jgi:hypothetical protein
MMKRFLLPGCLFFFFCICVCLTTPANAQDTTKKAEPEKKEVPQMVAPPRTRPIYHRHRLYPAAPPTGTTASPSAAARINDSTVKANALKAQQAQAQAQQAPAQPDAGQPTDKSLNGQYQYLLTKVFNYQQPLVSALWKNVTDTLNHERSKVKDLQAKLAAENKIADSLKTEASTKEQAVTESTAKIDTISLFGIVMTKSTYNLVMVGLVVGLAIALVVVILSISKYKYDAKHHIELHEELEEEYKTYKAKATEKELRLARELQTERNKLDELLGRG